MFLGVSIGGVKFQVCGIKQTENYDLTHLFNFRLHRKFVTSTFIFRRTKGIFQILSLKSVFLGPILYLVSFFVEVLLQIETSSIIQNLAETFLPNFFLQSISRFNPL